MPDYPPDPVVEEYKKHIDRTLIRENLKLTVDQRFANAMALARFAEELRRAGEAAGKRLEALAELEAIREETRRLNPKS